MSRDENSAKKVLKKESDKNKNKIFCDWAVWSLSHVYSFATVGSYWGIFAQSKKSGARETAVASERLWNDIRF
jgi:hypothetical protein